MSALREPFDCVNFRKTLLLKIHSLSESYEGYVNVFALYMHVLVILYMYLDYRKQTLRKKKVNACHCALTSMVLYDLTGV